ncbi:MAG: cobalamin biosynthesis protein CbiM [Desulfuromonadaceae bacterium GWC2_58_13]|nr:MAG: cobalamin biosynthesis protein CbiM [Desulfuromonadaceae bacterium GWC2_58_13]
MHMADALLSPAVGGTLWAATAGTILYASNRLKKDLDDSKIPLMGVLGAFIFAAQMINFTIPATGSSGHLGGGMILAILLGPWAAFLTMASVLMVQALFFADGGLLALGCNIFNLGVFPCFIAYPLIYKPLVGRQPTLGRITFAAMASSVVGLQLGALGVVLETVSSGVSELPLGAFLLMMQPIHLAIGVVEGLVTAVVVTFVWRARPEILGGAASAIPGQMPLKRLLAALLVVAVATGGGLSWFASEHPDGLEWAIAKVTGHEELESRESSVHATLSGVQERVALLPDYGYKNPSTAAPAADSGWPAVDSGTSVSGLVGGLATLLLAAAIGWVLKKRSPSA